MENIPRSGFLNQKKAKPQTIKLESLSTNKIVHIENSNLKVQSTESSFEGSKEDTSSMIDSKLLDT